MLVKYLIQVKSKSLHSDLDLAAACFGENDSTQKRHQKNKPSRHTRSLLPSNNIQHTAGLIFQASSNGFTLAELLVVVTLVGILSAIALPTLLGNIAKARQTEPKTTIGSVNSTQQLHRGENSSFATSMNELGVGLPSTTDYYVYTITGDTDSATIIATARDTALKGYSGGVVMYTNANGSAIASVMCEANSPGIEPPPAPVLNPNASTPETAATCPDGARKL